MTIEFTSHPMLESPTDEEIEWEFENDSDDLEDDAVD